MAPRLPFRIGERTVLTMTCRQCGALKSGAEFPRYFRPALGRIAYVPRRCRTWWVVTDGPGQPEERPMMRPRWSCCGWRHIHWCALDYVNDSLFAALHLRSRWICDQHDRVITAD